MSPDIGPVIDQIRAKAAGGKPWSLRGEEVATLLGIDSIELYRRAYAASLQARAVIDLSVVTGTFGPENVSELVALLDLFYGATAERDLEQAGIFFGHERRVDILETFLSVASRRLVAHVVDEGKLSAMLRTFGTYEAARDAYLAELPSVEHFLIEAVEVYCRGKVFGAPELARGTAEATLRLFLRRKIVSMDDVLRPVVDRLLAQAVREGYVKRKPRPAREKPASDAESDLRVATAERERAQRALEIQGKRLTPELLRSQYRWLMKRYHPDVNPEGLERAKQITAAYSLLSAALAR